MCDLTKKFVKEVCRFSRLREENGCDAIYCKSGKGKNPPPTTQYLQIRNGEVCVATRFYSTGNNHYDSSINLERMKKCSERRV